MIESNVNKAQVLRYIADFLEMADSPAKVKIGVKFKVKNLPVVNIPVQPIDMATVRIGSWVTKDIINRIQEFQRVNHTSEGQEILDQFRAAEEVFNHSLTKR